MKRNKPLNIIISMLLILAVILPVSAENKHKTAKLVEPNYQDSTIIHLDIDGVAFNFIKVDGGVANLGPMGYCQSDTFWMMETEVTIPQINCLFNKTDLEQLKIIQEHTYLVYDTLYRYAEYLDDDFPALCPNYTSSVITICEILNTIFPGFSFALPSPQQWIYAARGGKNSMHYYYSGSNNVNDVAWHTDNSYLRFLYALGIRAKKLPHAVKQKMPNELGLYDMCGNASELVDANIFSYSFDKDCRDMGDCSTWMVSHRHNVCCGGDVLSNPEECLPTIFPHNPNYLSFRLIATPIRE